MHDSKKIYYLTLKLVFVYQLKTDFIHGTTWLGPIRAIQEYSLASLQKHFEQHFNAINVVSSLLVIFSSDSAG